MSASEDPAKDLTARANEVHSLVLNDAYVLERFRQADRLFYKKLKAWWKANNAYEAALEPFVEKVYDCNSVLGQCVAQMAKLHKQGLHTSPEYQHLEEDKRSWIKKKAKADKELEKAKAKAELQDPGPCPMTWLEPPRYRDLPANQRDLMEYMFPDDRPAMTEEAARLRAYVLLTILHDHALKGGVVPIAGDDIWPRDDKDVPGDFAEIQWKSMQGDPYAWYPALDVAWATVGKGSDGSKETPTLTEDEAKALDYLNSEFPQVRFQNEIAAVLNRNRDTVSAILTRLMQWRCVSRPKDKKKGYVITPCGQKYIQEHFS